MLLAEVGLHIGVEVVELGDLDRCCG